MSEPTFTHSISLKEKDEKALKILQAKNISIIAIFRAGLKIYESGLPQSSESS